MELTSIALIHKTVKTVLGMEILFVGILLNVINVQLDIFW